MLESWLLWPLCVAAGCAPCEAPGGEPEFKAPVLLKAAGEVIRTEEPGYASPAWFDVDGDGAKDLVVGQFAGGKMKVYRNLGDGKLAAGEWLMVEDEVAEVPGVW